MYDNGHWKIHTSKIIEANEVPGSILPEPTHRIKKIISALPSQLSSTCKQTGLRGKNRSTLVAKILSN
jgi:2-polyprenyl-3-methyl-5-hydroxy-6-metoxy-1,4-benzoquinol methylase